MKHNNDGAIEISKRIINNDNSGIGAAFYNRSPRDVILEVYQRREGSPFVCRRIIRQEKPIRRARAGISQRMLKNSRVSISQKRTRSLVHS